MKYLVEMGALCSKRSAVDKSPSDSTLRAVNIRDSERKSYQSGIEVEGESIPPVGEVTDKPNRAESFSFPERAVSSSESVSNGSVESLGSHMSRVLSQNFRSTKKQAKVSEKSSLLGRASTAGLGKAVEVLDTLGSSMSSFHVGSGFVSGATTKGNKIAILAFEVANTIVKGANLVQSLSEESIKHLKDTILPSEGVQHLISKDTDELLRIAAADKREELKVFSGEVVRFGNRSKDTQWHNLDRYFNKLGSELTPQNQLKEAAETMMQQLMTLVQHTAELYHELHALDRFEQDYRRKHHEEESSTAVQRGDNLQILRQELKSQKKHVKSLKKKSLWSKNLEEVMEKFVDIIHFLYLEIHSAFGSADGDKPVKASVNTHRKLGSAGLALHYANIISQIDTLVSRSSSVPPNTRDTLYQGLPPNIKSSLRSKLQTFQVSDELTVPQIKAEMEKTLRWLVPIANNTTKAHHGFGWVGEWANTGSEANRKATGQSDLIKIETLHHADKEKTEAYILDLVVWLHHLISHSRPGNGGLRSPIKSPIRSPTSRGLSVPVTGSTSSPQPALTQEDQQMLHGVTLKRLTPGISKSQEFDTARSRLSKQNRLSKSSSHSPTSGNSKEPTPIPIRRPSMVPIFDFDMDRLKALDVIDRVDVDDLRKF